MSRGALVLLLAGLPLAPLRGQDSTAAIPALGARITRIRFFEGGKPLPGVLERSYAARFDSASTRTMYVELGLAYPPAPRAVAVSIECGFTAPSGAPAGTALVEVKADAGWELSVHAGGAGPDTPGGWAVGSYPVACRHGGRIVASGTFEIMRPAPAPPPPASRAPARQPTRPAGPQHDPNARVPAVLSGAAVGPLKARVTAVRLFESGGQAPEREQRVITTNYDALTTRFINIELEIEYPRAARATEFEIPCRFQGPDSTQRIPVVRVSVDAGWVGSYHLAGWGARNRGQWPEGRYTVVCEADGKVLATSAFTVVRAPAAVSSLGASLTHLRFFQSHAQRLPVETRRYGARFDGRTARWIKAEFGLVYPSVPAPVLFTVECSYTFPDGTTRKVSSERRIPAGWTGSVHAQGIGGDRPGSWPAGVYRVECGAEGKPFGSGSFEVFDADPQATAGGTLRVFTGSSAPAERSGTFGLADSAIQVEAALPERAAGDSTAFRCHLTDPAGIAWAFSLEGAVRERALRASGPVPTLDTPRLRGAYRVDCRVGARAMLTERFTVSGAAELPAADTRVVSFALYDGAESSPDDEAIPDVSFSVARLRSLWLVALLDHPSDQGSGTLGYSCRMTNARKVILADTGPQALTILPGDRALLLRQRLALLPKQRWTPGKLTVTCRSGPLTFLETGIDLTR
jgi:hypothetical protein